LLSSRFAAKLIATAASSVVLALGCSWDNPIWPKSKKSDTPLFRFVLNPEDGVGYIDREGRVVIAPILSSSTDFGSDDFFDGLARVTFKEEDWFIDESGRRLFSASQLGAGIFAEGLARIRIDGEPKIGFIDRTGRIVIQPTFEQAGNFTEQLAVVRRGAFEGYIQKDGTFAIPPKFSRALPFSDGAARVVVSGPCTFFPDGPCGFFNPVQLPGPRGPASNSPDLQRCRYSYIDKSGALMFAHDFPAAKDFSEGLAPVGDGKLWGYIDRKGTLVIPYQYSAAEPFSEGRARVSLEGEWGYIDKEGQSVVAPAYRYADDFSEGLAVVGDGEHKYWFIDKSGRRAIPETYAAASAFVMGRAHVQLGDGLQPSKKAYIDRTGRRVFVY